MRIKQQRHEVESFAKTVRPFTDQGNYITMHRVLFDVVMPELSPNAWKVLCLIVRKTVGWQKDFDIISYSQIREGTGIASNMTVAKALKELKESRLVVAHNGGRLENGQLETSAYTLNANFETMEKDDF